MSARTLIIVPQFPMSESTAPPKADGCLPREGFQGKSDSRFVAHLLKDVYNPATSPSSTSQFFTLPSSSPHSSIPHSTLIHINTLDYPLFSHCPEFRAPSAIILNYSFFTLRFSLSLLNDPRERVKTIDLRIAELVNVVRIVFTKFSVATGQSRRLRNWSSTSNTTRYKQRSAVRNVEHDPFPTHTPQLSTVSSQST